MADTDEAVEAPQPMVWHLGLGGLEVWGGGCMKNLNLFLLARLNFKRGAVGGFFYVMKLVLSGRRNCNYFLVFFP